MPIIPPFTENGNRGILEFFASRSAGVPGEEGKGHGPGDAGGQDYQKVADSVGRAAAAAQEQQGLLQQRLYQQHQKQPAAEEAGIETE